ncbi:hypothetical protein QL285_050113 [Trifolium repens]|nr:hypothetical protein QL285_050113 [Trifolium repens]
MENQGDSSAESILHVDDDSFFSKVQKSNSSIGQYSGCYYFSDKQGVIPFKWEEEPALQEIWSLARGFLTGAHTPGKGMLFARGNPWEYGNQGF